MIASTSPLTSKVRSGATSVPPSRATTRAEPASTSAAGVIEVGVRV